ncbi:NADP-dependent oxidoreductase [Candidatus Methylacidithermus pantelleriae]|uniref:Bifunctional protein: zinc-containing alcohol dehydrogenase quinone oxidoreductase (NADPH:quinone reductase) Similar to arginate lyase n=1 Tax=Candidatus Methylacidithermus pantelleriae TaxID=2744239 RepID=A0A8J2FRZ0_9BACT|nr:NADP-dependent oxidoreductase [Candidatus Methylacidithermus pantelleriae]CAF0695030.1 Bifunctional protein: zinc-containing alcohol dehydrogenase; quinone oxidoreductase (NADPH:quinone reductase); Similar to arginate lyase [Candidatus Methylacidithermus pantelleriae]
MKAVRIHSFGGPEVLQYEEAPLPVLQEGDLLVKVHAAGVNPVDWKVREGRLQARLNHKLPLILGWDFSGVVVQQGPGTSRFAWGDEVFARPDIRRDGSYAEYIAVREVEVARKPRSLDHIRSAVIPLAALTAWQSLFDAAKLEPGQTVLVHAAAGGVGHFAVQLAKIWGAQVIATASARNHDFVYELGADEVVDYTQVPFEERIKDVDVVFDTVGGETQERSWKVLRPGGILVSILSPPQAPSDTRRLRGAYVFVEPNAEELAQIAELVDQGKLRPYVSQVFGLSEARKAHELSQTGHVRGKLALDVSR